jgi:hypothetical protein
MESSRISSQFPVLSSQFSVAIRRASRPVDGNMLLGIRAKGEIAISRTREEKEN